MKTETEPAIYNRTRVEIPDQLAEQLAAAWKRKEHTDAPTVYYLVDHLSDNLSGVIGDGPSGWYDWFTWRSGKLTMSDAGYGWPSTALIDALKQMGDDV